MDVAIQGISIIATFALVHERVLEFLRWWKDKLPSQAARHVLDTVTQGAWAWLPAVALSLYTHADAFDAFKLGTDHQPVFFTSYLSPLHPKASEIIGCIFMGLAVSFGSAFWHDLAKGLIDLRGKLQDTKQPLPVPQPAAQLAQLRLALAPPAPAATGIVPT